MDLTKDYNIGQISLKRSDTDYEMITLHQFLKKDVKERTDLVMQKRVQFFDFKGNSIPLLDALRSITELFKKLRAEGILLNDLK